MGVEDVIKRFEGLRLKAYQDQGGVWTIGYGAIGKGIQAGTLWTLQQANERLASDVKAAQRDVEELVKVPLTDNQEAALVSFVFNLGAFRLAKSTLLKKLNACKYAEAADEFLKWCYVGQFKSPGLLKRRQEERALFLSAGAAEQSEGA